MEFGLEKNVHMQNHRLSISHNGRVYVGIIEDGWDRNSLLIWLKDFDIPAADETEVRYALYRWLSSEGYSCRFMEGRRL